MPGRLAPQTRYASIILAGGEGRRLDPLTRDRAKPAVPFGAQYRIIDFVLTNCVRSGFRRIFVATQYKAQSLLQHLALGWNVLSAELGEFLFAVPSQRRIGAEWYRGTADAVYQCLMHLDELAPVHVIVLSGDHIYRMDYHRLAEFHESHGADATLATIAWPCEDASRFGIVAVDDRLRVTGFAEKPAEPPTIPGDPGRSLVNMGIYVFRYDILRRLLLAGERGEEDAHDFGSDVFPRMLADGYNVMAWAADQGGPTPYWRDIGTLDSYFSANMDLVSITPEFNLYDESWPIRTYKGQFPPPKTVFDTEGRTGAAMNSLLSGGVIVSGSRVERSILSPNVRVHSYGHVEGCVIFEGVEIERGCRLKGCIVDKDVRIPAGTTLGYDLAEDRKRFHVTDEGVVVVPKGYDFSNVS